MKLGEYIKKYREDHDNMSARAFAILCGLSPQYVLNLEKGKNNAGKPLSPTMEVYSKIAKATGVREADLFNLLDDNVSVNPALTNRERVVVEKFRVLPEKRKLAVEAVLDGADVDLPLTKIIPLFAAAAGPGDPPSQDGFDDYEVGADSKAKFAVKISGDSMEPHLHDGDIVLCQRRRPEIGEFAVMMVDGFIYVKQYIGDCFGNMYLMSMNRDRADCDVTLMASGDERVEAFGTVMGMKFPPVMP